MDDHRPGLAPRVQNPAYRPTPSVLFMLPGKACLRSSAPMHVSREAAINKSIGTLNFTAGSRLSITGTTLVIVVLLAFIGHGSKDLPL